jgi:hypothetical protein
LSVDNKVLELMIDKLPPELINNVILHLDLRSVKKLSSVNRHVYQNCKYVLENQWGQVMKNEKIFIENENEKEFYKLTLEEKKIYITILYKLWELVEIKKYDKIYMSVVNSFTKTMLSTSYSFYNNTFTFIVYSPIDTFYIEKLLKCTTIRNMSIVDINTTHTQELTCIYLFPSTYTVLSE